MPFLKEDLQIDRYNWTTDTDLSVYKGQPSRRLFDRFNGNQVLFIINFYGSVSDKISIKECHRMEEMIRNKLPLSAGSEISVFNWLRTVC
jgi:hypothetical protein